MALDAFKCNHLTPLSFKWLTSVDWVAINTLSVVTDMCDKQQYILKWQSEMFLLLFWDDHYVYQHICTFCISLFKQQNTVYCSVRSNCKPSTLSSVTAVHIWTCLHVVFSWCAVSSRGKGVCGVVQDVRLSSRGETVWSCVKGFTHSCYHGADEQWRSQELPTLPAPWPRGTEYRCLH